TLFVGNISRDSTEDALGEFFGTIGDVTGARIITDRETGYSKGYGYVDYTTKAAAEEAIEKLNGAELDGRPLRVDMSTQKPQRAPGGAPARGRVEAPQSTPTTTLFLGNLPFNCSETDIDSAFSSFGSIASIRLPTSRETGEFRGFGYVSFNDVATAKAALDAMNGEYIHGRSMRIDYAGERQSAG
ncbi:hypothetical protein CXG81DRAFT_1780, partial [Caulochytrium protostelioides]